MQALKMADVRLFWKISESLRRDGAFVEAGENSAIVARLDAKPNAYGMFTFSYLRANAARLRAAAIEGVEPSVEAIRSNTYKGSRPLFVYIKKQHIGLIPGLDKFAAALTSSDARGEDGLVAQMGLVRLSPATSRSKSTWYRRADEDWLKKGARPTAIAWRQDPALLICRQICRQALGRHDRHQ